MPDTGASQSVISAEVARDANLPIRPTYTEPLVGEAEIVMCNDKHSAQSVVLVSADLGHSALISWQDLQKLHVIPAPSPQ